MLKKLKQLGSFLTGKTWEYVLSKVVWTWFLGNCILQAIRPCEKVRLLHKLLESYQNCSSVMCYVRQFLPCGGAESYLNLLKSEETWLAVLFIAYIPALKRRGEITYLTFRGWVSDILVAASICLFFFSLGYVFSGGEANVPLAYGSLVLLSVFTFVNNRTVSKRTDNKDAITACFIVLALLGGAVSYFEGPSVLQFLALGLLYCIMAIYYIDRYRNPFINYGQKSISVPIKQSGSAGKGH